MPWRDILLFALASAIGVAICGYLFMPPVAAFQYWFAAVFGVISWEFGRA